MFGTAAFPDDGGTWHITGAGAARLFLTRKLAIEPELVYAYLNRFDKDVMFAPNLVYEFGRPSTRRRHVPYLIGGVGVLHGIRRINSTTELNASCGFGVKTYLTDRVFVAPEARIGWEPVLRFGIGLGYRFGR